MNNYKFGNYICKLREERKMTQSDLARKLDVSDKAVSKWENGQAIPRMDTFEKLAEILGTTIDDILSASKDGIDRICFVNNFCSLMTIEVSGEVFSIKFDECKWVETKEKDLTLKIAGDIISDSDFEEPEKGFPDFKEKIKLSSAEIVLKYMTDLSLQANCVYKLTNVKPDSIVNINLDVINLGYKVMTDFPFLIAYPKISCDCEKTELLQVKGKNSEEIIKKYTHYGISPESGIFFLPNVFMPIRNLRFKHLCKPRTLKKNILRADYYHEKHNKGEVKQIKGRGCLSILLFVFLVLVYTFFIRPLIFMESEKPALVSADYSTIFYYEDVYVRVDELPEHVVPTHIHGWEDVRTDGLSRFEQLTQLDQVTQYKDDEGRAYLWLVKDVNYFQSEEPDYDDFEEHYVYVCENPDKSLSSLLE